MTKQKEYNLYLDECYADNFDHFCLAGLIIEKETYKNKVIPALNDLKQNIFGTTEIILHHSELSRPTSQFVAMKVASFRKAYEKGISDILLLEHVHGLAVAVHEKNASELYPKMKNSYNIAFQLIVENFVNFLERNNAKGNIIMESRNQAEDRVLINKYNGLKYTGTLFYHDDVLHDHLGGINFYLKAENSVGLQLADILPLIINRDLQGSHCKHPIILKSVKEIMCHYSVKPEETQLTERFGLKKIPH